MDGATFITKGNKEAVATVIKEINMKGFPC
jgi:hypothetical protein